MTQMSARQGVHKHSDVAWDTLHKEFKQLIDKHVYSGLDPKKMSKQQKKDVLHAINVIKEKRDGSVKGHHCANG